MQPASMTYGLPMMLAQPSPTPIIGTKSSARLVIDGMASIATPGERQADGVHDLRARADA